MQTYYIDVDEEITSIIDRLRKSKSKENAFVVPGRAMVLQSMVSLKLLKKEADKLKKKVVLVTQSQIGQTFAQKSGIDAQATMEGISDSGQTESKNQAEIQAEPLAQENRSTGQEMDVTINKIDKKARLENIGSSEFFDAASSSIEPESLPEQKEEPISEVITVRSEIKNKPQIEIKEYPEEKTQPKLEPKIKPLPVPEIKIKNETPDPKIFKPLEQKAPQIPRRMDASARMNDVLPKVRVNREKLASVPADNYAVPLQMSPRKEAKFQELFNAQEKKIKPPVTAPVSATETAMMPQTEMPMPEKNKGKSYMKKILFYVFIPVLFISTGLFLFYHYAPKAKISAFTRNENIKLQLNLTANAKKNSGGDIGSEIPAKIVEVEKTIVKNYDSTGKSASSSQKAKGKLVIFNEFSSSPQPLVATTRLLSENKKLFRLVKSVVVPGTTSVGGEVKPGAIEAEVVADETGEDFDIGPSKFTIPGFEGSAKFEKFYAKSETAMSGGASSSSEMKTVSEGDIDMAKNKTEELARQQIESDLGDQAKGEYVYVPGAAEYSIAESSALSKAGDIRKNFDYQVLIKAKGFIFEGQYVKQAVQGEIKNKLKPGMKLYSDDIKISYDQPVADFQAQVMQFKASANAWLTSEIDTQKLKNDLLGKNEDEIREIIKQYPQVREVEIDFWPKFISSSVPAKSNRVEIEVITDIDKN